MEIIIKKEVSKKTGKEYYSAGVDLGYKYLILGFGLHFCSELAGMSEKDLYNELQDGYITL